MNMFKLERNKKVIKRVIWVIFELIESCFVISGFCKSSGVLGHGLMGNVRHCRLI